MPNMLDHESHKLVKILNASHSGAGKTGALGSLIDEGFHLHILDFDNGLSPLKNYVKNKANLANVFRVMGGGLPLVPEEHLQPGDPVRIIGGPLEGLEGTVVQKGRRLHFVVEVQFLQRGVSVEIEAHQIRPLNRCPA